MRELKVGRELKGRRGELGLSLREVAEQTDLSVGFLSQLENDQVSPSLNSLNRLAHALRVPIFELLSADDRDPVVKADERPKGKLGDTGVSVEMLTNFPNWQMMPFYRTLEVGAEYEAVRIKRAREEWMYVLSGQMEVYLRNQDPFVMGPGDSIHFPSSRLEVVTSIGSVPLELICMMTPPA